MTCAPAACIAITVPLDTQTAERLFEPLFKASFYGVKPPALFDRPASARGTFHIYRDI
jgi:hypothetical protein